MNKGLLNPRRVLLVIAALLLINSVLPLRYAGAVGRPIASLVIDTLTIPLVAPLTALSQTMRPPPPEDPLFDETMTQQDMMAFALQEIEALRAEVARLEKDLQEIGYAREMADYRGFQPILAERLSYNANRRNPVITIDRGSADGLEAGMPVEWRARLVGFVEEAGRRTARVRLITHAGAKYKVTIKSARPDATPFELTDYVQVGKDQQSFYVDVFDQLPVNKGDLVHLIDDRFPRTAQGRILGQVTAIGPAPGQAAQLQRVTIRPTLPLERLPKVEIFIPVTDG